MKDSMNQRRQRYRSLSVAMLCTIGKPWRHYDVLSIFEEKVLCRLGELMLNRAHEQASLWQDI